MPASDEAPVVAVALPAPQAADVILQAWEAGEAVLPLDPTMPAPELRNVIDRLRPTRLLDSTGKHELSDGEPTATGVAAIVRTSGTTGDPRGVELTFNGLRASALAVSSAMDVRRSDRWLCCLPVHYVAGLAILARGWVTGAGVTVLEGFDVGSVRGALESGANLVSLVPTTLARLLDARVDLTPLRGALIGAAPLPEALRDRALSAGVPVTTTYGLTETWGGVVHDGHPLDGVEVSLGVSDEILVSGPMVTTGYRRDPTGTRAAFTPDHRLRTGDVGVIDSHGGVSVVDRMRDLIVTGGVNVSPTEVERVLATHPKVGDVCVAGIPDAEWGELVVAFVVPTDPEQPPSLADVRSYVLEHLSAAKAPRRVVHLDAIPRTAAGKPLRRLLKH